MNIAARAESACKELAYDLVVTHSTAEQAPDFALLDAGGVPLKGKSEPVRLAILVGDAEMKASPQFKRLVERYEALIDAVNEGHAEAVEAALADCKSLAAELEPGLGRYLDRVPERGDEFAVHSRREAALV